MDKHVNILGWTFIIFHILGVAIIFTLFFILTGIGILIGDSEAMGILALIGTIFLWFMVVMMVPGILTGIFLLKRKEWARIVALVMGFLYLFDFPFGTALGIYTIWVLIHAETLPLFGKGTPAPSQQPAS